MMQSSIIEYSFNKISDHLFQGSLPPEGDVLHKSNFDVLVLAASEWQDDTKYKNIEVIKVPSEDEGNSYTANKFAPAWKAAGDKVAERVLSGKNVLVTCMAGHNRSGMVVFFALRKLVDNNTTNDQLVKFIQSKRKNSLNNPAFVKYLSDCVHF